MTPSASPWRVIAVVLGTAAVYAVAGLMAVLLAGPPGYAAPLFPSAGIALAAVITYGRMALPGVLIGAFTVNQGLAVARGADELALMVPLLISLGASVQAGLGAYLVRRFAGPQVVLNAPRDVLAAGLLGGPVACLVSATVATAVLVGAGTVPGAAVTANWATWWTGDTLGVLIATPLVLTLIGQPASDWRGRRRTLALPLVLALGMVALVVTENNRLEHARQQAVFEREADRVATEAQGRLDAALQALQAVHAVAMADGSLEGGRLRRAADWWLAQPYGLQAVGHAVRLAEAEVDARVARLRSTEQPGFTVLDRDGGADRRARGELVIVEHIEPRADNVGALGVNVLSVAAARQALLTAWQSGEAVTSAPFALTQHGTPTTGVVVYRALYRGEPADAASREAAFAGAVFVTLRTERALQPLARQGSTFLGWCVVDGGEAADGARQRLAGPAGCESRRAAAGELSRRQVLAFAGRNFELHVWSASSTVPGSPREVGLLITLSGMAAAAMLGALLLVVTGHSRRTELAVEAATRQLRAQMHERLQAETAQREAGQRLRSILDAVPLGVMFTDPDGRLIECNPRLAQMLGGDSGHFLGRSIVEFVSEDDAPVIRRMRRQLLKGGADSATDTVRLRSGHGAISVRIKATAMHDRLGRTTRMVGVVEDITESLKLAESERALQRAEAANRAKTDFLSRMSHELRTPLNAMIGFAQLLGLDRRPVLAPHQGEWTQQIQRAGWHLLELINETLDLARIESGSVALKLEPVDLEPLVTACVSLVATPAAQRRVALELELDPHAPTVSADATRLRQVLTNLLTNAIKYNREGGRVTIASRAEGHQVVLEVTDTGIGMSAQQLGELFQPYNRLGREQLGIEGTGIGLVIVRRLAELMGGSLTVDSREGVGSSFRLSLPAAEGRAGRAPDALVSLPAPYQRRIVHYIEDNETNIEVMRGVLAQRRQVELSVSTLGLDGLAAVRRERPDLVLLDMQLPDISGLELLRHLKQDDAVADIPVIIVSADATPIHIERALTSGALHYVTKPLDVQAFLGLVDAALESAETRF